MPWQLTTPIDAGDLDPNGPYSQVTIMMQAHDRRRNMIRLELEYGNTVDGQWVPGLQPANQELNPTIEGQAYIDLVSGHMTVDGELTYDAAKRGLYEHLRSKGVISDGTVV